MHKNNGISNHCVDVEHQISKHLSNLHAHWMRKLRNIDNNSVSL